MEGVLHFAHRGDDAQRIAPNVEKAVVAPYGVDFEDPAPDGGKGFFGFGGGRIEVVDDGGDRMFERVGQALFIELPAEIEREFVENDEIGRDHVAGQVAREHRDELRTGGEVAAADVCAKVFSAVFVRSPVDHRAGTDALDLGQAVFDLAQLDPVAPDLHLLVYAAQEFDVAQRVPARQVPRAVHFLARGERVVHESGGG